MVPVDRDVARNVTYRMSTAGVDIERLSQRIGLKPKTLIQRLTEGSFRMRELAEIADELGCAVSDLTDTQVGAS